jgi:SPP1 family predicted phage head-tail adaptor
MRAGRLNHKVDIYSLASTQSATSGEMVEKWATALMDVWAEVSPLKGRELFNARQFQAEVDTLITIRYTTVIEIVPTMKITYKSHDYNIQSSINPFESNRELQILCTRMAT